MTTRAIGRCGPRRWREYHHQVSVEATIEVRRHVGRTRTGSKVIRNLNLTSISDGLRSTRSIDSRLQVSGSSWPHCNPSFSRGSFNPDTLNFIAHAGHGESIRDMMMPAGTPGAHVSATWSNDSVAPVRFDTARQPSHDACPHEAPGEGALRMRPPAAVPSLAHAWTNFQAVLFMTKKMCNDMCRYISVLRAKSQGYQTGFEKGSVVG